MTPSPTKDEALWALEQAKERGMIGPEDTALIFHSWTTHRQYLQHLNDAFDEIVIDILSLSVSA